MSCESELRELRASWAADQVAGLGDHDILIVAQLCHDDVVYPCRETVGVAEVAEAVEHRCGRELERGVPGELDPPLCPLELLAVLAEHT